MEYVKATENDLKPISKLVQETIKAVYPKYYPKEVVDYFCELHCEENILEDIKSGSVSVLKNNNEILGTGCRKGNRITRVYVNPAFQKHGYGSYILQCLENEIKQCNNKVILSASLPANIFYEKRGYKTLKHEQLGVENDVMFVWAVMEKQLA